MRKLDNVHVHIVSWRHRLKAAWFLFRHGGFALERPEMAIGDNGETHYREPAK